jgi:subtilase family serine protease
MLPPRYPLNKYSYYWAPLALLCLTIVGVPICSALYDFESIPLKIIATGEVSGDVLTFGQYGLQDPPVSLAFDIPYEVQWARTYVAVWGGTPRYTGWVGLEVNNGSVTKTNLYGRDDKSENVYVTGYGVYWVAYDTTPQVKTGHNTLVATTSRTDPNSKLDGRIYAVVTVVVMKDPKGVSTRYWIAEGNENLHGEGWSGTNPTKHDEATATFPLTGITGMSSANLSVLYLASGRGQPDYLLFNGQDLGSTVTDTKNYPNGARDIADETSFNAGFKAPVVSRYVDAEIFDVKNLIRSGNNEVKFQRGRDLTGDGVITESGEKPEGEDYLHPVFAMLVTKMPRSSSSGPDLSVKQVTLKDAYAGENATISVTLENLGAGTKSPVTVLFSIDGNPIGSQTFTLEQSGIQQVSTPWTTTAGHHTIQVEARVAGDTDISNNIGKQEVDIGALPDLVVSLNPPVKSGDTDQVQKSPLDSCLLIGALVITGIVALKKYRPPKKPPAFLKTIIGLSLIVLVIGASIPLLVPPASAQESTRTYTLPVTIKNIGGSDATAFAVTVYLDGEKIALKDLGEGLKAVKEITADIPVHTTPGSHQVRVVADETATLRDANRANNVAESAYTFP